MFRVCLKWKLCIYNIFNQIITELAISLQLPGSPTLSCQELSNIRYVVLYKMRVEFSCLIYHNSFIEVQRTLNISLVFKPLPKSPMMRLPSHHFSSSFFRYVLSCISCSRASNIPILLPSPPHIALDTPYAFLSSSGPRSFAKIYFASFHLLSTSETSSPLALYSWRRLQAPSCDDLQLWRCLTCHRRGQGCHRQPIV